MKRVNYEEKIGKSGKRTLLLNFVSVKMIVLFEILVNFDNFLII